MTEQFMRIGGTDGEKARALRTGRTGQIGGLSITDELFEQAQVITIPANDKKEVSIPSNMRNPDYATYSIFVRGIDHHFEREEVEVYTSWLGGSLTFRNYETFKLDPSKRVVITDKNEPYTNTLYRVGVENKTNEAIQVEIQVFVFSSPLAIKERNVISELSLIRDELKDLDINVSGNSQYIQGQDIINLDSEKEQYPDYYSTELPVLLQSLYIKSESKNKIITLNFNGVNEPNGIIKNSDDSWLNFEKLKNDGGSNGIIKIVKYDDSNEFYALALVQPIYLPQGFVISLNDNVNARAMMSIVYFNEVK